MLNVVWYNINGIKGKALDVVSLMETEEIDVLMIQEATEINEGWYQKLNRQLSRINCVLLCDVPNKYLATIVRTTTVPTYGVLHSQDRLQVIKVEVGNRTITLANHYGPHKSDLAHYRSLKQLISRFSLEGKFVFGGDHNAVSLAMDRTAGRIDCNTKSLVETMTDNNLFDVNDKLGTERFHTFYKKGSSSRIDTVWCNRAALEDIEAVRMYTQNGVGSDHVPTLLVVETDKHTPTLSERTSYRFPKDRRDPGWVDYAKNVVSTLKRGWIQDSNDVDSQCELITSTILEQAQKFRDVKATKTWRQSRRERRLLKHRALLMKFMSHHVWCSKLDRICSSTGKNEPRVDRVLSTLKYINDSLHQARAKKATQKYRKWEWVARTSEFSDPSRFFSAASAKKSCRVRLARVTKNGMQYTDPHIVGEVAADYFEEAFKKDEASMGFLALMDSHSDKHKLRAAIQPFKTEEVTEAIRWLRNRKCPGADGVHNEMVKLPRTKKRDFRWDLAEILCDFFNNITATGKFPRAWKECVIIPAYKKGDVTRPENYRPICLLSSLSKLYTKLLNQRISKAAEEGGVFTNVQGGARKFRDIREKLSLIRGVIDFANRHDKQLYLLLTDISKAFDSVPHNAIEAVYRFFGFPEGIVKLVSGMVRDNHARVLTSSLSRRFRIGKGTRQGDSLSPTTYILVHQVVLLYVKHQVKGFGAMTQRLWNAAYVDDCNLFAESRADIEIAAKAMSTALGWLRMTMHPDKLELYVRKVDSKSSNDITVDGTRVVGRNNRHVFRALGLYTNLKGATQTQREQAWQKAQRVVVRLKIMRLTARQVSRVVNTCIHPIFAYASEFTDWTAEWLDKVNALGRSLVKFGSKAMKMFPTELLSIGSELGSVGLKDIEETIATQTGWFVFSMINGKRDTEARRLFLDTLEDIKHHQTFQQENVFQSSNRLENVASTYHKWCAIRMHTHGIRLTVSTTSQCDECRLARYVPSTTLKKLYLSGIVSRNQLLVEEQPLCFKEFKQLFPTCKIGAKSHQILNILIAQMRTCQCPINQNSTKDEPALYKGNLRVESREHLQSLFDQERNARVEKSERWWIQKDANYSGADFCFLKYPHSVDRRLEWFQLQVRSGTLHTEDVVRCLYNTCDEPTKCVWCNKEPESVLHCLIRCPRAVYARRCLALTVSKELIRMGVSANSCIDIWFDNVRLKDGKMEKRPLRWTSREFLKGMMGIETNAIEDVTNGLVAIGIKTAEAGKKAKTYVNGVKRRCLTTLLHLFTTTKAKQQQ